MDPNPFSSVYAPSSEFVEWCKQEIPEAGNSQRFSQLRLFHQTKISQNATFENLKNELPKHLTFDESINELGCELDATGQEEIVYVMGPQSGTIVIKNLKVHKFTLRGGDLKFINCKIKQIIMQKGCSAKIRFVGSYVGCLTLVEQCCGELEMVRGAVLNIDCPPPMDGNPFIGSVVFSNVFFPKKIDLGLLSSAQPYRNMKHHLISLENEVEAAKFHSLELVIERASDPFPNKQLSYLYAISSDYGGSILRPILWLFLLLVSSWMAVGYVDGAETAMDESLYHGWQKVLLDDTAYHRAMVLVGQYVFNPFGLLGVKALVVAKTGGVLAWMMVQSFCSATLITLLVLSIRRRFKLNT